MRTNDSYNLPDDLAEVSAALDRLADDDGERAGLEQRVFDTSRGELPTPPVYSFADPAPEHRPLSRLAPLRLAAGVALAGGLVVVWMAARSGVQAPESVELASELVARSDQIGVSPR